MNRHGCTPRGDVCMEHHLPLDCNHGCWWAEAHKCKFKEHPGWRSALSDGRIAELKELRYGPTESSGKPMTRPPPDLGGMIHQSHAMRLDNGSTYTAYPGQWFGTWRCTRKGCRAQRVRRTDSDWLSAEARDACTGDSDAKA